MTPAAQTGTAARPVALFVMGVPRSGTSALARVLALCGATLPAGMKGADRANPRGYWEPRQALHLNDAILRRHGSAAFDTSLRLQEEGAFDAEEKAASPELSSALWLKYNLLAERHTRALPRVFVDYANLLDDWRREITRISAALAIDLNTRDEGAIEEFLTPDLQRQRHCGPVTDRFGTDWMSAVYEALRAAARDEPWDGSALDRVFEAYRASEHDFRTAFENCRDYSNSRLGWLPPSILKLNYEILAMAHRRRGTWA